jgi:hypothetical protein
MLFIPRTQETPSAVPEQVDLYGRIIYSMESEAIHTILGDFLLMGFDQYQ